MKLLKISLCIVAMLTPTIVLAQRAQKYQISAPIRLLSPVKVDTANLKGEKFQAATLLDTKISMENRRGLDDIEADTAAYVLLERPAEGTVAYLLCTKMAPKQYAAGTLEVESNAMCQVFVDGNSEIKKAEAEDTIGERSVRTASITMLPATEHKVVIKAIVSADTLESPKLRLKFSGTNGNEENVKFYTTGKRAFEQKDMAIGARVNSISLSPDGKYVLASYYDNYGKDKGRGWTTVSETATGKVIATFTEPSLRWMPKGSRLYRVANGREGNDVYVIDVPSMQESLLWQNVPEKRFEISPQEDYLIYYEFPEAKDSKAGPLRFFKTPDDRVAGNNSRSLPIHYDPNTGISTPLTFGNRSASISAVRPDGKKAILEVSESDASEWPFYFTDFYEIDFSTLQVDTLISHDAFLQFATYSPDGTQLFFVGGPSAFDGVGSNCGTHPIPNNEDGQGYIYDLATKAVRPVTKDFNPSISNPGVWNSKDGMIYLRAENGFCYSLYQLNPKTGEIKELPSEIGYIQNFSVGREQSDWLAYMGQSYDSSGRAYLVNLKKGQLRLWDDPWREVADDIEWGKTERWCFTSNDGTEIEGFITYPPQFDPEKKYPMIVYYYGGTSPTLHNTYSPYNAQLFASRGYVVYQLNPSGTTGYGQEFSARHVNAWGEYTADDIICGVTKMLAEHEFVDSAKVGAIGCSYGGFMTEHLLTKTDLFAAAVSHAGISNVTSYWGVGDWGYSYNALAAAKNYPWNNPKLYTESGALFNADKINTPLLMTHGTADNNVPMGESIQLYNALKILDKDVELITVDNEDHYISQPDNKILWNNAIMAWFAKYLQDAPQWWESIQP